MQNLAKDQTQPTAPFLRQLVLRLKLPISLLLSLLILLVFLDRNTNSAAQAKNELGWSLTQNRKHLGLYKVSMARSGMRIEMPNQRIIALCLPPGKTVFVVNIASKRLCQVPLANFEGQMLRHLAIGKGMVMTDVPVVRIGQTNYLKVETNCYGIDTKKQAQYASHAKTSMFEKRQVAQSVRLLALADCPFAAAGRLMTKVYGLPKLDTIPIDMHYTDPEGGGHQVLETLSISRTNIDNRLVLPTGLKQSSLAEVLLDGNESAVDILNF
jgi:hypothetical protein